LVAARRRRVPARRHAPPRAAGAACGAAAGAGMNRGLDARVRAAAGWEGASLRPGRAGGGQKRAWRRAQPPDRC
jgi:hypothetical protein